MQTIVKATFTLALGFVLTGGPVAAATIFSTNLSGANEVPPTGSTGSGSALITLVGNTLDVSVTFSGLTSPDSAAHIHCCGALGIDEPIAVPFTSFPTGVTSGTFAGAFDLTDPAVYNAAFLTANGGTAASAEVALIAGMSGQAYVNVHTANFPNGEIRGQLAAVPEPTTLLLGGSALAVLALMRRRKAQSSTPRR
jgi:hypothetical protein